MKTPRNCIIAVAAALTLTCAASAQPQRQGPRVESPVVSDNGKITFRIHAPKAESVRLVSSDLPDLGRGADMTKGDEGVWELTAEPPVSGAYRYHFSVDGVSVVDPRNPATSESNMNTWSLVYVPGSETWDARDVPRGAVAEITYYSKSLKQFRRMHVYTPPGYQSGEGSFPVFYLLHGAFDCDDSWTTVGRAGFILDNLIADGKAKPMVVVMPDGHTGPFQFGASGDNSFEHQMAMFQKDFVEDVKPYIEKHYRVKTDRAQRAIAGLSMGGGHTLNIAFDHLKDYAYIGVYSSGIFGISDDNTGWEDQHAETLKNAKLKEGLDLVWFSTGKDDFLIDTSRGTVQMLKKHGFDVKYHETNGGHTWINWRDYLRDFAPLLFH